MCCYVPLCDIALKLWKGSLQAGHAPVSGETEYCEELLSQTQRNCISRTAKLPPKFFLEWLKSYMRIGLAMVGPVSNLPSRPQKIDHGSYALVRPYRYL